MPFRRKKTELVRMAAAIAATVACCMMAFACLLVVGQGFSRDSAGPERGAGVQFVRSDAGGSGEEPEGVLEWRNGAQYRADQVLVQVADGIGMQGLADSLGDFDFVATPAVAEDDVVFGWVKLDLAPGTDVAQAIAQLETSPAIAGAQPNFVYHALEGDVLAADALVATTLQVANEDDDEGWQLDAIHAQDAWTKRKTNHAVTVAVIDSGCDVNHVDLKDNIVDTYNVFDGGKDVTDSTMHGTHVAGIVAAVPDNEEGVAGTSYNAGLVPIKVMEGDTTDTVNLIKAYRYVMDNAKRLNIRVVNMSLGAEQEGTDADDKATLRAIDEAYFAGILSVFAAGNEGKNAPYYCFPCDYAENGVGVINVNKNYNADASVKRNGLPDSSSNYNMPGEKTKDLSAPGWRIKSTVPGDKYETMTGTSMATPVVAGVAALVFAQNQSLDAGQAKSVLCSAAEDIVHKTGSKVENIGFDDYTGYGLVRADKAVTGANDGYISGGDSLAVGSTLQLSVPRSGSWTWSSNAPGVATVSSSNGSVKGVAHGEAVISATNGTTVLQRTVVVYETKINGPDYVGVGLSGRVSGWANPVAMWTYRSTNPLAVSVDPTSGVITGQAIGKATIVAQMTACPSISVSKKVSCVKIPNPLKVTGKTKKVKYVKVKKKARKVGGCISVDTKGVGKLTYHKVSSGSSKRLSINKKTGKVTVKKGTKRGTYKIKVKVKAAGDAQYESTTQVVTAKVRVR